MSNNGILFSFTKLMSVNVVITVMMGLSSFQAVAANAGLTETLKDRILGIRASTRILTVDETTELQQIYEIVCSGRLQISAEIINRPRRQIIAGLDGTEGNFKTSLELLQVAIRPIENNVEDIARVHNLLEQEDPYLPIPKVFYSMGDRQVRSLILADSRHGLPQENLGKRWILIFFPTQEHARAFPHSPDEVIAVAAINYNVLFSRVSGVRDINSYVDLVKELYKNTDTHMKIQHILLGGHGASDRMVFSDGGLLKLVPRDPRLIVQEDRYDVLTGQLLANVYPLMQKNTSKILLLSCQTGRGKYSLGDSIAHRVPGITIMAPEEDVPEGSVMFTNIDKFDILRHESLYRDFKYNDL